MFAWELEHDWRPEIECGQSVDEQSIVFVSGLPNNWPQNSTQLLSKSEMMIFHVIEPSGGQDRPRLSCD